ncbi:mannose-1-phosphate guanyltransferase alpha [Planococcus citri]|uniref:mannose-1-phosphate guanyltransferase alpha n=1 Tax=Planococcus citri TaxID=170843 RepID=UPI0031F722DE
MLKAVILIGGPLKGTRFRPLSLDIPKPLFPVAGLPIIQHHIEACVRIPELKEIILLGYYPQSDLISFVQEMIQEYKIAIRYLQEFVPLGTGGGMYHFRDQIRCGNPTAFFVINGDVCGDFPLLEMCDCYGEKEALIVVLGTEATRNQSVNYGCIVSDKNSGEILHYVEKPSTFVSTLVNCGVYLCSLDIFQMLATVFKKKEEVFFEDLTSKNNSAIIELEQEVLRPMAGTGKAFVYQTTNWWSQLKSAGSAIYANRHCLQLYKKRHPERLTGLGIQDRQIKQIPKIIGDVFIHPTAYIHHTAVLGPNVSIGANVHIGPGVRIRESIILSGASISNHSLILYSVVGRSSKIGAWTRVEGTPCDPNPNKPFAKMDNLPLFNSNGKLNPSITILGSSVTVPAEVVLLNSIVLPYKELSRSFKNEIIL